MSNGRKVNLKMYLPWLITVLISVITLPGSASFVSSSYFDTSLTDWQRDTLPKVIIPKKRSGQDTIPGLYTDSISQKIKKSDTLNLKTSRDSLDAPVNYAATDSMVFDVPSKKIFLYNESSTKYKDIDLSAYRIELDQQKQLVIATYFKDSTGKLVGRPKFVQGENNMDSDSMSYNFKTQKGITNSTYTSQGEMFVHGDRIKKISLNDYYAYGARITTCNLDTPHFAFIAQKLKLVNKKLAISGPIHPEFEGVPVPIYIPFGFFPLSQGRHSGLLPPQFTVNEQFGVGLEQLGYYKVINDNFDVVLRSDIYSYGGYRLNLSPSYRVRYRYQGQFNLAYQNTRFLSDGGAKEYETNKSFNIFWSHSVDSKARPGTSFSANVNAGSTKFNRYVTNNATLNYQNQLSSSISYSKNWNNKYNLSVTANHNQNNNLGLVNLSLPNVAFSATTIYPFQRKEFIGEPKWYEKLGVGLNSNILSQAAFYDSAFNFQRVLDTFQIGATHSIPITLSLPSLGPFQIAPGISYQEKWYTSQYYRRWNDTSKSVQTYTNRGFYTARDISFSLGINTAIFGTFDRFNKNSSVKAIRHVIRPSFSLSYKPDLAKSYFYETQIDTFGHTARFSPYDAGIVGSFSEGKFGGIGFGLDNNLEMKVRSKDSTGEAPDRKVKLLDGFGFNGSYNLIADSQKLSLINFYARSTLFEKINITASAILDPYKADAQGARLNQYAWEGGKFTPGRFTNGNVAVSTSFRSKETDKEKAEAKKKKSAYNDELPLSAAEQEAELEYIRRNPAEFADFNIPWSVNISYSLNFTRRRANDYVGFVTELNSNINLNGDFNLTPKWKAGMNTYYDFKSTSIQSLSLTLSREMHCWQMSISVTPVGIVRYFSININPKSGLLRDIKVNRSRSFYNY